MLITTSTAHGLKPGDRIAIVSPRDTNRVRRVVVGDVTQATEFDVATFWRPSRGFAKHIRRKKAKR